ncbi:2-amino-4-hydroxy-6-hydroxymethyldihydropteridine diphosphokinase [Altererythrobacter luteolus]|uniref:2-amino-4-hydroxy-6-hydroxymethyldihydropteridine pyrophosphokinase n=1 Tax=Pontixanthobacter luteolus TaxID=295089 RepID=A0A6I4V3A1_9SPHN|nr:2-amino-4-hydroxy-6-hydroxymethyldihydropteridine diphosphokinase [Pontixanthobacter luteolus]MXP48383.1 2-amino-4-hydroxy-6-hydroxymethyldihydropteridine diphosphokinase [Pontixanthobacter luteolus]
MTHRYLIGLGSNIPHPVYGKPAQVVRAAFGEIDKLGSLEMASPVIGSAPLGPSRRRYANAAAMIESSEAPSSLLRQLKKIERAFGVRRGGRWQARVLDLDIIMWSGGIWASSTLAIPHPHFRQRAFVLGPASAIAPLWRDPISSLSLRQLNARLTKPRPTTR